MDIDQEHLERDLLRLLRNNRNTETLFLKAAKRAKMQGLTLWLIRGAIDRAVFQNNLSGVVRQGSPEGNTPQSYGNGYTKFWIEKAALFEMEGDENLFGEVIRAEKRALQNYRRILDSENLPLRTASVLHAQTSEIARGLSELRDLILLKHACEDGDFIQQ